MADNTKDTFKLQTLAEAGSSSDEERLPLYEEYAERDISAFPSDAAPATEVRGFLYQYLKSQCGLDEATARNISEKWTIGTGAELRTYPFSMYMEIFDAEAAWTIYRHVRALVLEEQEPSKRRGLIFKRKL